MSRLRAFAWLIALAAFVLPSLGMASMAHAMASVERAASVDCPDHRPMPDPCPEKGTARHAAGDCCPLMAAPLALLPGAASIDVSTGFQIPAPVQADSLAGRLVTQDPPPPRV